MDPLLVIPRFSSPPCAPVSDRRKWGRGVGATREAPALDDVAKTSDITATIAKGAFPTALPLIRASLIIRTKNCLPMTRRAGVEVTDSAGGIRPTPPPTAGCGVQSALDLAAALLAHDPDLSHLVPLSHNNETPI